MKNKHLVLVSVALLGLTLGVFDWSALPARAAPKAAIYTVTRTDDPVPGSCASGDCSLREAVIAANSNSGSEIVLTHGVTYTLTILRSGADDATTGNLNITADTRIDFGPLRCASNCLSTIRGGPGWNDNIFTVGTGVTVQMVDFTITNGNPPGDGGGIYNSGNLTLRGTTVISNTAINGGGIFEGLGSALALDSSYVLSNTATGAGSGGGVFISPSAIFTNSLIAYNHSDTEGGGIYANGSVTLTGTSVMTNTSVTRGGGVSGIGGTLMMTSGAISSNQTTGPSAYGGGLNWSGSAIINGTDVSLNKSQGSGGGIYFGGGSAKNGQVTNATINNNQILGTGLGGGVFSNYTPLTLLTTTVSNNATINSGGGLAMMNAPLTMTNSTFSGNTVTGNDGGAIAITYGGLMMATSLINGNSATGFNGSGLSLYQSPATIMTSTISNNPISGASLNGGGLYFASSPLTMTASTVSGNRATQGGGIYAGAELTITNSTISGNTATTSGGGGIYQSSDSILLVSNATVTGNQAPGGSGGGVYVAGGLSPKYLKNSLIAGNTSPTGPDCLGTIASSGYNLIGNNDGCSFSSVASDQVGTGGTPVNPLLAPLGNYGGPTQTHALKPGSPALDYIPNGTNGCGGTLTQDQRGNPRPQNGSCDIGAFEGVFAQLFLPLILR